MAASLARGCARAGGRSVRGVHGARVLPSGPLDGFRVLELGQLIAGPFCGTVLGYFGATVIKIEPLGGDPIRTWRELDVDGTSPWFRSVGRNKRSVALNLKSERARELVRQLAVDSDVLIENFKPGTMEKWGLGPDELKKANPGLVYTRISGYGQTGPLASKPGFASACEAFGGFRHVNGFADRPSVRPNLSMGDTLAGLHAALGATLALLGRERGRAAGGGRGMGDVVDVAIYEAVFNLMEGVVPEYDRKRVIRQPSGSSLTGIAPTNTYLCSDGKHVVVGGNGDSIFKRLMTAIGRPELGDDPRMADNLGRVTHSGELDQAIGAWTAKTPSRDVQAVLDAAGVPCGQIYSVEDMFNDDHYKAREMFERVRVPALGGEEVVVPALCPKLESGGGATHTAGPAVGEHTREVLQGLLGISDEELQDLIESGAVGKC